MEDLLADQRRAGICGEARSVEQYLADNPSLAGDDEAAVDLIYQEFLLRSEIGPAPSPADTSSAFPITAHALDAQLTFLHAIQALAGKLTMHRPKSSLRRSSATPLN